MRITRELGPRILDQGKKCNQLSITTVTSLPQTPGVLLLPKRNRSGRQGGALIWWCDHSSGEELLEENGTDSKGPFFGRNFSAEYFAVFFNNLTWLSVQTWGKLWKVDLDVFFISLLFILTFVAVPGLLWDTSTSDFTAAHHWSLELHLDASQTAFFFPRPAVPLKVTHVTCVTC